MDTLQALFEARSLKDRMLDEPACVCAIEVPESSLGTQCIRGKIPMPSGVGWHEA